MPVDYRIFDAPPLVAIRYHGHVETHEITRALGTFAEAEQSYADVPHLFDLTDVTSYDFDYPEFFRLIGKLAEVYPPTLQEQFFVFLAPPGIPAELAATLRQPYDRSDTILVRVATTRVEASEILGFANLPPPLQPADRNFPR